MVNCERQPARHLAELQLQLIKKCKKEVISASTVKCHQ